MLHAFDPDHLAAVAGVSTPGRESSSRLWQFAAQWSLGHGGAITLIALPVLIFGMAIPHELSHVAEQSVAFMLIALGVLALWKLTVGAESKINPQRSAPLVGLIHGMAGSAPLLALIPMSQWTNPGLSLLYVLFFSAGVAFAMTAIAFLLAYSMRVARPKMEELSAYLHWGFALFALGVGISLLI